MKLTFEEACMAVADLFEAAPETWTKNRLAQDRKGLACNPLTHPAERWCVVGAIMAALNTRDMPNNLLRQYAVEIGWVDAVDANNIGGRLVAIRMLRIASGELKP